MQSLPPPLQALAQYNQFILWQPVWSARSNRWEKLPVNPHTGAVATAHDPALWLSAIDVFERAIATGYNVGFTFTDNDPLFFIDIDSCTDADSPNGWSSRANELLSLFPGAAVEVSHSGSGLHILGHGRAPSHPADRSIKGPGFDLYTSGRFIALTGTRCIGDIATEHTPALQQISKLWLPPKQKTGNTVEWDAGPVAEWDGPADDNILVSRALRAKSAASVFGNRANFKDLWEADTEVLSRCYPDDHKGGRPYDESDADMALAQHLAFWTGNDCARIERLMHESALYRDKWDTRDDYLRRTITKSCEMQSVFYTGGNDTHTEQASPSTPTTSSEVGPIFGHATPKTLMGEQILLPKMQVDYFKGCTYIQSVHRVITPSGALLKPDQFRASYGGYVFTMDAMSEKISKNAWEVFTESQAVRFPKVHDKRFLPLRQFGEFTQLNGRWHVNTFVPLFGARTEGDPDVFLDHMRRLLPDDNDRDIFVSYLAACVQYVGRKFQWCPLLQGVEGNGKTVVHKILSYALGEPYCHLVDPEDLSSRFNAWVEDHLLVTIEELHVNGQRSLANRLKPLITNDRVALQSKGVDQRTGDNCANFIMFSNYQDAVLKNASDRRYAVFYTAQQSMDDLRRDGLDVNYFNRLFEWLENHDGYAITAHYLATRPVNVNVMGRAPETSSSASARRVSLGVVEQLILDAVDMHEPGFRGGLVCTREVSLMLAHHKKNIAPQTLAHILTELGYIKHPALASSDGRVSIMGMRRRIYVDPSHDAARLPTPDAVSEYWTNTQN